MSYVLYVYVSKFKLNVKGEIASELLTSLWSSVVVCESKQAGHTYRHFILFLTLKRQREREEKNILLSLLATHMNVQRPTFIVCV